MIRWRSPTWPLALMVLVGCSGDDGSPRADTSQPPTTASTSPPAAATSATASATTSPPDLRLLPDMSSLPAEDVHLEVAADGTRLLRFAAVLANTGRGPLVMAPDDAQPCPEGQRFASQLVYLDADGDGAYSPTVDTEATVAPAGCMLDHPTHGHWHLDASARYDLTGLDGSPVSTADKVSFCLRDTRPLPVDPATVAAETFGDCEYGSTQGISAGWGDVYRSDLDGQALPLPAGLPDGLYCLTLSADPLRIMGEVDDDNNASTIGVQLTATSATAAGSCPSTPR